jgi:hypothetical protein
MEKRQVTGPRLVFFPETGRLVVEGLEAKKSPHLEDERRRVDGLLQEVVGPRLVARPERDRVAQGCEHDHGKGGAVELPNATAGLESAQPREANVEDDQVEGLSCEHIEGLFAGFRPSRRVAVESKEVHQRARHVGIVVHDKDS